jgi:peptidyl-prolyl cis-trans isomerase D
VRFSASQLAPTIKVDEAEVQRQFNFRRDSLSEPERRTIVQVPAPNQAAATQVAARLRAGEAPAAVARALKVEPVRYEAQPRTAVVDRRAAAAAFALPAGGVSAPFQGDSAGRW